MMPDYINTAFLLDISSVIALSLCTEEALENSASQCLFNKIYFGGYKKISEVR